MDPSNLNAALKATSRAPFKFTQSTKEYKLLQSMMESGEVTPAMRPSDVKALKDDFKKIDTDKFRAQFNKLKDLTGLRTREGQCVSFAGHCTTIMYSDYNVPLYEQPSTKIANLKYPKMCP